MGESRLDKYRTAAQKTPLRYIARFIVESASALRIGTGDIDNPVVKDANGLPYIPGTSLAGIIRHAMEEEKGHEIEEILGFQAPQEDRYEGMPAEEAGMGSRIQFSSAYLLAMDGKYVHEGLDWERPTSIDLNHQYYQSFSAKVIRDNVAITHKGTAKQYAKYDTELVHKGARFVFELELIGNDKEDAEIWEDALNYIQDQTFRVGAGTRNGFGKLKVLECTRVQYDLQDEQQMKAYLDKSSSLNAPLSGGSTDKPETSKLDEETWEKFKLSIESNDFFLFGAGEEEARPKKERFFKWGSAGPRLQEAYLLPATSIKGAIAHRTAFHYNLLNQFFIEQSEMEVKKDDLDLDVLVQSVFPTTLPQIANLTHAPRSEKWDKLLADIEAVDVKDNSAWQSMEKILKDADIVPKGIGEQNTAVSALFGIAKQEDSSAVSGHRGRTLFDDVYLTEVKEKVFNHVAIDRFTGGGIDGALFASNVANTAELIEFEVLVKKEAFKEDEKIRLAFQAALKDLEEGRLQLGGQTTKGHGVFQSTNKVGIPA